jgi:hypothetical protein
MLIALFLIPVLALLLLCLYVLGGLLRKGRFVLVLVLSAMPFVAYKAFQYYWYAQVLPAKFEIAYPVAVGDESYFREGCGVAVYKLSANSLDAIKKQGLEFFNGATQARGYSDPSDSEYNYHTYMPWKQTPLPAAWTSEGSWFMCSVISVELEKAIVAAAKQGGAYYTSKDEGQLLVLPSLGYVVFSFYG